MYFIKFSRVEGGKNCKSQPQSSLLVQVVFLDTDSKIKVSSFPLKPTHPPPLHSPNSTAFSPQKSPPQKNSPISNLPNQSPTCYRLQKNPFTPTFSSHISHSPNTFLPKTLLSSNPPLNSTPQNPISYPIAIPFFILFFTDYLPLFNPNSSSLTPILPPPTPLPKSPSRGVFLNHTRFPSLFLSQVSYTKNYFLRVALQSEKMQSQRLGRFQE